MSEGVDQAHLDPHYRNRDHHASRRVVDCPLKPDEELTISSPEIAFISIGHGNVTVPTVLAKPGKFMIGLYVVVVCVSGSV